MDNDSQKLPIGDSMAQFALNERNTLQNYTSGFKIMSILQW